MKPKHLKYPFPWEKREPLILDRVFYIPANYHEHQLFSFPDWEHPSLFGNTNPVHVEYCSGNGTWIAEKALQHPEINWLAVEIQFKRVRKIWSKIQNEKLPNLLVASGDANDLSRYYLRDSSVDAIYINFPDPWPKKRHAKHRIIQPSFINEMNRTIKKNGIITFVTDDPDYSMWTEDHLGRQDGLKTCHPSPYYITELPGYGTSYFENLWREKGKRIHYHQYERV
jgi:tRNA (guanine-N7-)-methyltransferase